MRTLYDVLGVRPDVDDETIRQAFRALSKAWHPDANVGDRRSEHLFKQVTAAYVTLKNAVSRAAYDASLEARRRLRRQRRKRELVYCLVVGAVSFGVACGGLLFARQRPPAAAWADAVPWRAPPAAQDETPSASVSAATGAAHQDLASLPQRVAVPLDVGARFDPSASLTGVTHVRVSTGIAGPDGLSFGAVRTFTVSREPSKGAAAAADPRNPSDRTSVAQIRVWTALHGEPTKGSLSHRMRLFTVAREQSPAGRL
jgi:hypothetical protein